MFDTLIDKTKTNGKLLELKLRHGFPIKAYLEKHYPDGHVNGSAQFMATCCHCGKKNKFYYNLKTFSGLCHSCYVKRDGAGFKTVISLIMFTESLEYPQALERLKTSSITESANMAVAGEIAKFMSNLNGDYDDAELDDIPIQVDIPMQRPLNLQLVEEYFNNRKRPMTMEILKMFPAYMSDAKFLDGRMVFKVETNDSYAWLGYLMGKATDDNPKTLNPFGSVLSYMLHGYNYIKNSREPLLTSEGVFDHYRNLLRGYSSVASFGKVLSAKQIALLNNTRASEIVLCYDGDSAGMNGMWKVVKKWKRYISKPLSMMILPYGEDPDSCSKKQTAYAFDNRREII